MAHIVGPLYSHWRRSHAGCEGQQNVSQSASRADVSRPSKNSSALQNWRSKASQIARQWRNLSEGDRHFWDEFGALYTTTDKYGEDIFLPGYNWFLRFNSQLALTDQPLISNPPLDPTPSYNPFLVFSQLSPGGPIVCEPIPQIPEDSFVVIYRSLNCRKSKTQLLTPGIFFSSFPWGSPIAFTVANETELKLGSSRTFFRGYGLDKYGRIGEIRVGYIDPL